MPAVPGEAVFYLPGERRAALSLAGDLGLPAAAVVPDAGGPAPLTLSGAVNDEGLSNVESPS